MRDDAREELERIERELLAEEPQEDTLPEDDILADELIREVMAEHSGPAFEDPDVIHEPEEPMVYCNYSNDYGKDLQEFAENGGETDKKKKDDKIQMGLMIAASCLSLGIIGVLIYWIEAFLK